MINRANPNASARSHNINRQTENRTRNENKRFGVNNSDKIEISKEAKAASKIPANAMEIWDEHFEQILSEFRSTGTIGQTDKADDDSGNKGRDKLAAMKIAKRIANGDNVPIEDHRWLAEYDSSLYKAALQASLIADNDDPKDYDSLIEEMFAEDHARASAESVDPEADAAVAAVETTDAAIDTAEIPTESVDVYY